MLDGAVITGSGPVLGVPSRQFDNVTVFKGIPYAASTAGENRWRPPSQPAHWVEPRLCDTFGPACPQIGPAQLANMSEDCLSLNVWTPAASPHDHKLPVYVWIYGGRFIFGAASEPTFDGAYLASQGIVVVTINYRLGVFGFLAHPELSAESAHGASGNYGLLDQLCAMQWVRDNIANFGGDPLNVTLGGQSAGSASVGIHLYSPLSRGFFHRAIVESGMRHPQDPLISALAPSYRTKEKAETQGQAYVAEKGVKTIAQLRQVPVEHLLIGNNRNDETMWGNPPFFRPCIDGYIFPRSYSSTLAGGSQADVPVLTGHNRDEGGTYSDPRFDRNDYIECTEAKFGPLLPRFDELYPCGADQDPREVWSTAARDNSRITIDLWAQEFAKHCTSPVFTYHFTHAPPPRRGNPPPGSGQPKTPGYTYTKGPMAGSFHSAELFYAFNNQYANSDRDWTSEDAEVGKQMSAWWLNFIKRGDVNGKVEKQWPLAGQGQVMEIGSVSKVTPLAQGDVESKVQFWRDHFARHQRF
jgi:para-nitrobenzyl esterase